MQNLKLSWYGMMVFFNLIIILFCCLKVCNYNIRNFFINNVEFYLNRIYLYRFLRYLWYVNLFVLEEQVLRQGLNLFLCFLIDTVY